MQEAKADTESQARIRELEQSVVELTSRLDEACRALDRRDRVDALTGLANRKAAMEWLEESWDEDRAGDSPLSVLLVDVDGLSLVNESFGPKAGDRALARIGRLVAQATRTDDLAGRVGGDEMLVVLPDTGMAGAQVVARKVHEAVAAECLAVPGGFWQASVSIGIAERRRGVASPSALVALAARHLAEAKRLGHGLVVPMEA